MRLTFVSRSEICPNGQVKCCCVKYASHVKYASRVKSKFYFTFERKRKNFTFAQTNISQRSYK
jgi:hypothetical protein